MKKLTREQAMIELIDAVCPVQGLTYDDASKLARLCEAVASLYEKGGSLHDSGLGLGVKPAKFKEAFWTAIRSPAHEDA